MATGEIIQSKHPIFVLISWYKHLLFSFFYIPLQKKKDSNGLKKVVNLPFILNKMHNFADANRKVSDV